MSRRRPRASAPVGSLGAAAIVLGGLGLVAAPAIAYEIGPNDFRISDIGPNGSSGYEAQQQKAAYDPTNDRYLVVWRGDEQADLQAEIHGQFVDARTGAEEGTNDVLVARIGPAGEDDTDAIEPAVAFNSTLNEFLVVFVGDESMDAEPIITDTYEIYVQRVSAAGALIGSPQRISDMGADDANGSFDANAPSVAYNATDNTFLVAWRGDDDTAPYVNGDVEIWGQMLGYSGGNLVEIGTNDVSISAMGGAGVSARDARFGPVVAWNSVDNSFLAAWDGDGLATDNEFEVFGQALTGAGMPTGVDDFRISTTGSDGDLAREVFFDDLAYNPTLNEYLVTWQADNIADNDFEIYGQRLNGATLAEIGGDTRLTTTGTDGATGSPAQFSSVAYNERAQEYYLVWEAEGPGLGADEVEVFGQRLTGTLGVREAASRLTDVGPAGVTGEKPNTPDVVASGPATNGYLLTWNGSDTPNLGTGEAEVFGQLLASSSDLAITKSVSDTSPAPGQTINYTLDYVNNGPDTVFDAVITDPVPALLTGVSFGTAGTAVVRPGTTYVWDVASLAPGAGASITITGTVPASAANGTAVANAATIATTTLSLDTAPGTNSGSADAVVDAPPTVTIEQAAGQADPTNATPIAFTATFSEPVTDFTGAEVTIGGTAGATTAAVAGGPAVYTVSVSGMTGDGTVTAAIAAGVAVDVDGDTADPNTASTSTDATVTYDATPPTLELTTTSGDPTNVSPIPVTATFSEDVVGFDGGDVVAGNATVTDFAGGPSVFTFSLVPATDGLVTGDVAAGAATDLAGNGNTAAETLSVTFDGTGPTPTLSTTATDPTGTSPIPVTIQFDEEVIGFDDSDLVVTGGTPGSFVAVDGDTFTVEITPSGDGTVTVDVPASAGTDALGNPSQAAAQLTIGYDGTAPGVTLTSGTPDPFASGTMDVAVQFTETVTGFDVGDVDVVGGTAGSFAAVDGDTYTLEVTPTASGSVEVSVPADAATDAAGNGNAASETLTRTFDPDAPTVTVNQAAGQADPTLSLPIEFEVEFSEDVDGFDESDVVVGGTAGGSSVSASGSGSSYVVSVGSAAGAGTVVVSVVAGAATDAAGNASEASTSTDNEVTYEPNQAPVVEILPGGQCAATGAQILLSITDPDGDDVTSSVERSAPFHVFWAALTGSSADSSLYLTVLGSNRTSTVTVAASDGTATTEVTVTVVSGSTSNDELVGTAGPDVLIAGNGSDVVSGLGGNDLLCGGNGNDVLDGGEGNDTLLGQFGDDQLTGGPGADAFTGGFGNDTLVDFNPADGDVGSA